MLRFTQNQGQQNWHAIVQAEERRGLALAFREWETRGKKVCIIIVADEAFSVKESACVTSTGIQGHL